MSNGHVWQHRPKPFSNCTPSVSPISQPSQITNIFTQKVFTVKYECFNLTGVCWTVCCLTYTTCSTVHIHSFHKKYIFVYTAFTISYNRAVAGTCVWMDVFFFCENDLQRPQNTSDSFFIIQAIPSHHNASCVHISSFVFSPAAWSGLTLSIRPSVSVWFAFLQLPVLL